MASNVESDERREERLRRRECDRFRREREDDEERHIRIINVILKTFCNSTSYRLARGREYDGTRHAIMCTEHHKALLEQWREQ